MLKTKTIVIVLSMLVLMALLCFTACTPWQARVGQKKDVVTNNTPKVHDEQEQANTETPSYDKQEDTVIPEIEQEKEPDTKIFFGEEYIKRDNIELPKYVLKNIPTSQVKKQEYKLVTPTQEELDEIVVRLDPILSMCISDYNCQKDNIYEFLFSYDHLGYVYPEYDKEVAEYIAKPLVVNIENNFCLWDVSGIYHKDPLNKFSIPDEVYDENGNVNYYKVEELYSNGNHVAIGYNMFSGEYIDWLIEGVWNSKTDHETFFELEDGTMLYYYDGNYYTPELWSGRGGGIMNTPYIQKVTPLGDNKYEIEYYITYDVEPDYYCKAIIGLKENADGFRFWSIFSIDYNYTGNKFNY